MKGLSGPDGSFNADSVTFGKATARAENTPAPKKHPNSIHFSKGANIDPYINGLNFGDDIIASNSTTRNGDKLSVTNYSFEKNGKQKPLATVIVSPDGKTKYIETGKVMYKANMDGEITDVLTGKEKKAQHLALFGKPRSTRGSCET